MAVNLIIWTFINFMYIEFSDRLFAITVSFMPSKACRQNKQWLLSFSKLTSLTSKTNVM